MGASATPPHRPLVVAHRAGNDLEALKRAETAGVDLVEADVWLYRGRLEVRHRKTAGPVPILWDRWELAHGFGPRLILRDLAEAAEPGTDLMLDLKGSAADLPGLVREVMETHRPDHRYTVSSQWWQQLEPFRSLPHVRVIHSIGSARQLGRLTRSLGSVPAQAVAIDRRLLTAARVAALREIAPTIFTWTVNERAQLDAVLAWGVDGIITDDYELVNEALGASP